jgi:hypothetical protein
MIQRRIAIALALSTVLAAVTGQTWLVLLLGVPTIALNYALSSAKLRAELAPYGSVRPAPPARSEPADGDAPTLPTPVRARSTGASDRASAGARS